MLQYVAVCCSAQCTWQRVSLSKQILFVGCRMLVPLMCCSMLQYVAVRSVPSMFSISVWSRYFGCRIFAPLRTQTAYFYYLQVVCGGCACGGGREEERENKKKKTCLRKRLTQAYMCAKRLSKETHMCEKRLSKETHMCENRPVKEMHM